MIVSHISCAPTVPQSGCHLISTGGCGLHGSQLLRLRAPALIDDGSRSWSGRLCSSSLFLSHCCYFVFLTTAKDQRGRSYSGSNVRLSCLYYIILTLQILLLTHFAVPFLQLRYRFPFSPLQLYIIYTVLYFSIY